jgi:hypothetical protein
MVKLSQNSKKVWSNSNLQPKHSENKASKDKVYKKDIKIIQKHTLTPKTMTDPIAGHCQQNTSNFEHSNSKLINSPSNIQRDISVIKPLNSTPREASLSPSFTPSRLSNPSKFFPKEPEEFFKASPNHISLPNIPNLAPSSSDSPSEAGESERSKYIAYPVELSDLSKPLADLITTSIHKITSAEKAVYSNMNEFLSSVEQKITSVLNHINVRFKKDEAKNSRLMENIRVQFDQEATIRKREKHDFMKEMEAIGRKIKHNYSQIEGFLSGFERLKDIVDVLAEEATAQQVMQGQDEVDRKGIGLFGIEHRKKFDFYEALRVGELNRSLDVDGMQTKRGHKDLFCMNNTVSLDKN